MERVILRIIVVALVALATLVPQAIAFARPEDSDNGCPPRAEEGTTNASDVALEITTPINPPADSNAWSGSNPGNK